LGWIFEKIFKTSGKICSYMEKIARKADNMKNLSEIKEVL